MGYIPCCCKDGIQINAYMCVPAHARAHTHTHTHTHTCSKEDKKMIELGVSPIQSEAKVYFFPLRIIKTVRKSGKPMRVKIYYLEFREKRLKREL